MPFPVFNKYEDIPEGLGRDNFRSGSDGKWYAQLTDDHPLVKKKQELLTANSTLTSEKTQLENKAVPSGHRIVPLADFTLLELIKQMNLGGEEIKTRLTEYPNLKEKEVEASREKAYEDAGKYLKYTNLEAFKTAMRLSKVDVTFKPEKVDNVDVQVPYVGDKRLSDHITNTSDLKMFEPFWKTAVSATAPQTEAGSGSRPSAGSPPGGTSPANQSATETGKETPKDNFRFTTPGDVNWE
jgi:hypothetical protein